MQFSSTHFIILQAELDGSAPDPCRLLELVHKSEDYLHKEAQMLLS